MRITELPLRVIDRELEDMGIEQKGEPVKGWFRIDLVESAYPSTDKQTGEKCTHVNMVSGDEFQVYMLCDDFIEMWIRLTKP